MPQLTQEYLKQLFTYDKDTGEFTHRVTQVGTPIGSRVGYSTFDGYKSMGVAGKQYQVHRLAWLYSYGKFPKLLDHINGIRTDNRLSNLREVTSSQNCWNSSVRVDSVSGVKGISFLKGTSSFYRARVGANGKRYVASFPLRKYQYSKELAFQAAKTWIEAKRKELHGDFANNG